MELAPRYGWRRWLTWLMTLVLVVSVASWFFTRDTLPEPIKIATAVHGGLYHELGQKLDELLDARTGHKIQLIETQGSQDNCNRLRDGEIDIAIVQAGAVSLKGLAVVSPLHHDAVVVLVQRELLDAKEGGIRSVTDLVGRRVIVGTPESGMRRSAHDVLSHYGVADRVATEQIHFNLPHAVRQSDQQDPVENHLLLIERGDA